MNSALFPRSRMALLVGFGLASLLLHGCGGSGHGGAAPTSSGSSNSAHAAQATVTVNWPARPKASGIATRLIPLASNSITITITQGGHPIAAHTLVRPAGDQAVSTSYTFGNQPPTGSAAGDNLPVGTLTATAAAYPSADGTGTAQASGSITIVTTPGTLPGDTSSSAAGINSARQVVGNSSPNDHSHAHAFLYSNGTMQDLGTLPGGSTTFATGINSAGQVVDSCFVNISSNYYAFLYSNSTMQDLNTLIPANSGWFLGGASGINDSGQICGSGSINGQTHAFLLTPVAPAGHLRH